MNTVSIRLDIPGSELGFFEKFAKGMGWHYSNLKVDDCLYDAETGMFLNEQTMQSIREIENGTADLHYADNAEDLIAQCME